MFEELSKAIEAAAKAALDKADAKEALIIAEGVFGAAENAHHYATQEVEEIFYSLRDAAIAKLNSK